MNQKKILKKLKHYLEHNNIEISQFELSEEDKEQVFQDSKPDLIAFSKIFVKMFNKFRNDFRKSSNKEILNIIKEKQKWASEITKLSVYQDSDVEFGKTESKNSLIYYLLDIQYDMIDFFDLCMELYEE